MVTRLENPPIRELVLDIRVTTPKSVVPESFSTILNNFVKEYPNKKTIKAFESEINLHSSGPMKQQAYLAGYLFSSADDVNLVQFRKNGMTVNRLGEYQNTSFESELEKAKTFWQIYKEVGLPITINRIAVRVINEISLPLGKSPLKYLSVMPQFAAINGLELIEGFFNRQNLVFKEALRANLIVAYNGEKTEEDIKIILDIDAYKVLTSSIEETEMWDTFNMLNDLKNEIFVKSFTEEGWKRIK